MCKRGDIYYVELPKGMGSEQGGKRPFVIIQNDIGNKFSPTVIGVPATKSTNNKTNIPTHFDTLILEPSTILCEQIMTVSKERLGEKIGVLDDDDLRLLDKKLKISIGLH
jgi:mRNA interferase MazF